MRTRQGASSTDRSTQNVPDKRRAQQRKNPQIAGCLDAMEPGGIEPPKNALSEVPVWESASQRATERATEPCPLLAELVEFWPSLSTEARVHVVALGRYAVAETQGLSDLEPTPIGNPVERSFGRKAIQCEHGGVVDRLPERAAEATGGDDGGGSRSVDPQDSAGGGES